MELGVTLRFIFLLHFTHLYNLGLTSQGLPASCSQISMMEMRTVVTQAIENARAALMRQKQLNEYLSRSGKSMVVHEAVCAVSVVQIHIA